MGARVNRFVMSTSKFPNDSLERVTALLKTAREAAGYGSPEDAVAQGIAGINSPSTIRNWEKLAGQGQAIRPILYMRELARRSTLARDFILDILGIKEADLTKNLKVEQRLDLYREAFKSDDETVQLQLRGVEALLRERFGKPEPPSAAEPRERYGGAV